MRSIVLAHVLAVAACATPPSARSADDDGKTIDDAPHTRTTAADGWADATQSPWPSSRALPCGASDAALERVAARMVSERARGLGATDPDNVVAWMRENGEPHVRPRIVSAIGRAPVEGDALRSKLEALRTEHSRCAFARAPLPHGGELVAAIIVDALADLAPLPTHARTGAWMNVEAKLNVHAEDARVVVLGPRGLPRTANGTYDRATRTMRARFVLDRPGAFTMQLVGDLPNGGPRPLLEARVFADVAPTSSSVVPGEENADTNDLAALLERARDADSAPPLTRDARLDAIAATHAARMLAARTTAHDVGEGDLRARFAVASLDGRIVGENVAHAANVLAAHRAIYASPSHRLELLRAEYTHYGAAVARGDDGSAYVCEVFASELR